MASRFAMLGRRLVSGLKAHPCNQQQSAFLQTRWIASTKPTTDDDIQKEASPPATPPTTPSQPTISDLPPLPELTSATVIVKRAGKEQFPEVNHYEHVNVQDMASYLEKLNLPESMHLRDHPLALSEKKETLRQLSEKKGQLKMRVVKREVDKDGRAWGTGRRKAATATVWIQEGTGKVSFNGKPMAEYVLRVDLRENFLSPLILLNCLNKFDIIVRVKGGGNMGQTEAARLGLAKALQRYEPNYRPALRKAGLLTTDSRQVRPKRAGQPKAVKKHRWVKR